MVSRHASAMLGATETWSLQPPFLDFSYIECLAMQSWPSCRLQQLHARLRVLLVTLPEMSNAHDSSSALVQNTWLIVGAIAHEENTLHVTCIVTTIVAASAAKDSSRLHDCQLARPCRGKPSTACGLARHNPGYRRD